MQIIVRDNNVEQAHRILKRKLQREGVYREMKMRRFLKSPRTSAPASAPRLLDATAKPFASASSASGSSSKPRRFPLF